MVILNIYSTCWRMKSMFFGRQDGRRLANGLAWVNRSGLWKEKDLGVFSEINFQQHKSQMKIEKNT
jgi:hypothetical protein